MLRLNQKLIRFAISSPQIAHSSKHAKHDPKFDLYPVVGLRTVKVGALSLNQPNNQNSMTIEMMQELFRFLNSYHNDRSVENIWMENRGNMFCSGMNLYEMKNNVEYLDRVYGLMAMIAKQNKPIITYCRGSVRNIGAYILSMSAFVMTNKNPNISLRFDEASKGFIPIGGGTHRLSRIPANLGIYLAVTGKKLNADEMSRLGFIHGHSKDDVTSKMMRTQITDSNLFFSRRLETQFGDDQPDQLDEWNDMLKKREQFDQQTATNQANIVESHQSIFTKFAMNQYRLQQVLYQNTVVNPYNSFKPKQGRNINNYYMMRHQKALKYLENKELIELSQFENLRIPGLRLDKVDAVFGKKTLKEAVKALEEDGSPWAKETLHEIKKMDPLAAALTFELIRRAEGMSWDQCLEMEYLVGRRLINQSQLELKTTKQGTKYVLKNYYSTETSALEITDEIIQGFFAPPQSAEEKLELPQIPKYALLPTSDYKHIPDSARFLMNEYFFNDNHFVNQQIEAMRYLKEEKVYIPHQSYEVPALREKIHQKQETLKVQDRQIKRIEAMLNNSLIVKDFIKRKENYIDNLSNEQLQKIIDEKVKQVFNQGLTQKRFGEFQETADTIGKKNKMRLFRNIRDMLVKSVILDGDRVEKLNSERNRKLHATIHFSDQGKSYFETESQFVKKEDATLNTLMHQEIGQKLSMSQSFTQNEGNQVLQKDMGYNNVNELIEEYDDIHDTKRKDRRYAEIIKRYENDHPYEWDRSFAIKQLVEKASQTSEELAQYLEWTNAEFYTTIVNQPSEPKTYNLLGEKVLEEIKQQREKQIQSMSGIEQSANNMIEEFVSTVYKVGKSVEKHQKYKGIFEAIVPEEAFPIEMRVHFHQIYKGVLNNFIQKYLNQNGDIKQRHDLGDFDNWVNRNIDQQFVDFYKWDIQYVFSYLAILRIKQILYAVQKAKDSHREHSQISENQLMVQALNKNQLSFSEQSHIEHINPIISKFLYRMLDMHTIAKSKIKLPQTKLLDYMNRVKINRQTNFKSNYTLSFEALMLMIGKDRSKLYNKVMKEYLPTEPQYLIELSNKYNEVSAAKSGEEIARKQNFAYLHENYNMISKTDNNNKKQLIAGWLYYMMQYEALLQKASGKYNFMNEQTLKMSPQKTKAELQQIMNMSISSEEWVERVTKKSIEVLFESRLEIERKLTKGELQAFDQDMKNALDAELFREVLKHKIHAEIASTKQFFKNVRHYDYERDMSDMNEEMYCNFRKNVKNRDAFKRLTNLHLATSVRDDYFNEFYNEVVSPQEAEDLASEKKEFSNYERFPQETRDRMIRESLDYGPEREFEKDLKIRDSTELPNEERTQAHSKMSFVEDEKRMKKEKHLTDFDQELMTLKGTLTKKNDTEIDSLYQKLEALI